MIKYFATSLTLKVEKLGTIGEGGGLGPFSMIGNPLEAIRTIAQLISNLVAFITVLAGFWFGFQIIMGAFAWITSAGDKANLESARNRLVHAALGLIIVVASWAIIAIIGKVLGLDILMTDPTALCKQLSPDPSICTETAPTP